ncbi:hypothetical protein ACT6QH_13455 [Xanthobacter sp. TB0139]
MMRVMLRGAGFKAAHIWLPKRLWVFARRVEPFRLTTARQAEKLNFF